MSSAVAKLDVAKWGKVQADHPDAEFAGVPFDGATHDHKKECTRLHLVAAVEAKLAEAGAGGGEGESKGDAPRTRKKSKCGGELMNYLVILAAAVAAEVVQRVIAAAAVAVG